LLFGDGGTFFFSAVAERKNLTTPSKSRELERPKILASLAPYFSWEEERLVESLFKALFSMNTTSSYSGNYIKI
jgi:hypothetical protein